MINALSGPYMEYFNEQSKSNESVRTRELDSRHAQLEEEVGRIHAQILETGDEFGPSTIAAAHLQKVTQIQELDQRISELSDTILEKES